MYDATQFFVLVASGGIAGWLVVKAFRWITRDLA